VGQEERENNEMKTWSLLAAGALTLLVAGLGVACGDDDDDGGDDGGNGGAEVAVTLREWEVNPVPASVDAGEVTFTATNDGPEDVHELVVVKTDLAPDALPTADTGSVDEEGEGVEVIGEIEEFAVGTTESATFTLEAGSYVLLCNIYDEEEQEAHYQQGMRIAFTVN
jgi:uncharacterized cupredoxin-like copper-binding protein